MLRLKGQKKKPERVFIAHLGILASNTIFLWPLICDDFDAPQLGKLEEFIEDNENTG
jgi:hypothetical protein